ncbi:hypothetical protein D6T65_14510 [Arthrobacter frigidicola]|nr:hypothetical protein D6T65_14510 [Arthrobacter frigidicola]
MVLGFGALALLSTGAVPANAASSQGMQSTEYSMCFTDEISGDTFCQAGTERNNVVRTPSGVLVSQGEGDVSVIQTISGETTSIDNTHRYVSVFRNYVDPFFNDPQVIRIEASDTSTLPDGSTCTITADNLSVKRELKYQRDEDTCHAP